LDLVDEARVRLAVHDEAGADTLLARYLRDVEAHPDPRTFVPDRSWALMLASSTYLLARPARWAAGERLWTDGSPPGTGRAVAWAAGRWDLRHRAIAAAAADWSALAEDGIG
jgi:hypothetical protein